MVNPKHQPESYFIPSTTEAGLQLHLAHMGAGKPVLFVHGATLSSNLYYAPVPGRNWLAASAASGLSCYALDVRGYGRSTSEKMWQQEKPYARAADVIHDIDDAINWITDRHGCRPSLVGTSWGSVTGGLYASTIGRDKINRLVLAAPIFAEKNDLWRSMIGDPDNPDRLDPIFNGYRATSMADLMLRVDEELSEGCDWHADGAIEAVIEEAFTFDARSHEHSPPRLHSPNGTFADLIECFNGRPQYDPKGITAATLLIRGSQDLTSTRTDMMQLFDLLSSEERRYVEIANGGHFFFVARNAGEVFDEANSFLHSSSPV